MPRFLCVLGCLDKTVDLSQEALAINAVHHASLLDRLASCARAAQAVHADGLEQRSRLRSDVQNITDNRILFNLCSHEYDLLSIFTTRFAPFWTQKVVFRVGCRFILMLIIPHP